MNKVAVFSDASRITHEDGTHSTTYGWIAVDMNNPMVSFAAPVVKHMVRKYMHSTVHAELLAVYESAVMYKHMDEVHIFTDSLYAVAQVHKVRYPIKERRTRLRVYPELIEEIANMSNVFIHHVSAHSSFFFNELVDQMVRFVAIDEMTVDEAEEWARATCRHGVVEIVISKNRKPKYVKRGNEKMMNVFENARA